MKHTKDDEFSIDMQWNRVVHYLDRLTQENEQLEKDLAEKKHRREMSNRNYSNPQNNTLSTEKFLDSANYNSIDLKNAIHQTIENVSQEYKVVKEDLGNLLNDINQFKKDRSNLATRLYQH